jgi:hypothetical protein
MAENIDLVFFDIAVPFLSQRTKPLREVMFSRELWKKPQAGCALAHIRASRQIECNSGESANQIFRRCI